MLEAAEADRGRYNAYVQRQLVGLRSYIEKWWQSPVNTESPERQHLVFGEAWDQREREAEMPIMEDLLAKLSTLAQ